MRKERGLINRILFATDFSLCARHAEEYVVLVSHAYEAAVEVVHVLELYPGVYVAVQDHSETDGRLAEVVARLRVPGRSVTGHQQTGIPSVQICEFAFEHQTNLIMMGTHGRTGLDHIFLGSTAERVLTMAPCPVLTVRAPKGPDARHHNAPLAFKQIVVPVDFSDCSLDALEYGTYIAKDFDASLTLLHVLESVAYDDDPMLARHGRLMDGIDSQLRSYARAIQSVGVSVRQFIRDGVPADTAGLHGVPDLRSQATQEKDTEKRKKLYAEFQRLVVADVPQVFTHVWAQGYAARADLVNVPESIWAPMVPFDTISRRK